MVCGSCQRLYRTHAEPLLNLVFSPRHGNFIHSCKRYCIRRRSPMLPIGRRLPESLSNHPSRRFQLNRRRHGLWLTNLSAHPSQRTGGHNPRAIADPKICADARLRVDLRYGRRNAHLDGSAHFSSHCQTTRNGTVRTCGRDLP
jgi:hypothetical protein